MGKIIFRFSLDKTHHADVIKILESVPKSMRTIFLVDAIRYSASHVMQMPFENLTSLNRQEEIKSSIEIKNEKVSLKEKQTDLNLPMTNNETIADKDKHEKQPSGGLSVSLRNVLGSMKNHF